MILGRYRHLGKSEFNTILSTNRHWVIFGIDFIPFFTTLAGNRKQMANMLKVYNYIDRRHRRFGVRIW